MGDVDEVSQEDPRVGVDLRGRSAMCTRRGDGVLMKEVNTKDLRIRSLPVSCLHPFNPGRSASPPRRVSLGHQTLFFPLVGDNLEMRAV